MKRPDRSRGLGGGEEEIAGNVTDDDVASKAVASEHARRLLRAAWNRNPGLKAGVAALCSMSNIPCPSN